MGREASEEEAIRRPGQNEGGSGATANGTSPSGSCGLKEGDGRSAGNGNKEKPLLEKLQEQAARFSQERSGDGTLRRRTTWGLCQRQRAQEGTRERTV